MQGACVVPVAAQSALDWAAGRLEDRDLLLCARLVPQAVFIVNLAGQASYRETILKVRYWHQRGARLLIARAWPGQAVARHLLAQPGCLQTFHEAAGQTRYAWPPATFDRWAARQEERRAVATISQSEPILDTSATAGEGTGGVA